MRMIITNSDDSNNDSKATKPMFLACPVFKLYSQYLLKTTDSSFYK